MRFSHLGMLRPHDLKDSLMHTFENVPPDGLDLNQRAQKHQRSTIRRLVHLGAMISSAIGDDGINPFALPGLKWQAVRER